MSLHILYSMVSSFAVILDTTLVHAAPVISTRSSTTTEPNHPRFVPSPQGRGTLDIFFTCAITLMLCVWTAIHPNIITNPTVTRTFKHRATYLIIGLIIPECVLGIAINEWRKARKVFHAWKYSMAIEHAKEAAAAATEVLKGTSSLGGDVEGSEARQQLQSAANKAREAREAEAALPAVKEVKAALDNYKAMERILAARERSWVNEFFRRGIEGIRRTLPLSELLEKEPQFGMEGAFFAVMGGYTFCPLDHYLNPEYRRTLSADAIKVLLQMGIVDGRNLAKLKNEIKDKGKANVLAKLLVCGQAMWMVINCFLRRAAGLPITIIELNVIVHVFCAVIVYACWWKKPHDAGSAISLDQFISKPTSAVLFFMQYPSSLELHVSEPRPGDLSFHSRIRGAENFNIVVKDSTPFETLDPNAQESEQNLITTTVGEFLHSGPSSTNVAATTVVAEAENLDESPTHPVLDNPIQTPDITPDILFDLNTGQENGQDIPLHAIAIDRAVGTTAERLDEPSMPPKYQTDRDDAPETPAIPPDMPLDLTGQERGQNISQSAAEELLYHEASPTDVVHGATMESEQHSEPPMTVPPHLSTVPPDPTFEEQYLLEDIILYREPEKENKRDGPRQLYRLELTADERNDWAKGIPPLNSSRVFIDSRRGVALRAGSSGKPNITAQEYQIFASAAKELRSSDRFKHADLTEGDGYPIRLNSPEEMTATQNSFNLNGLGLMWIPLYLIYGGVHSLLWSTYFPSPVEQILWRISCILVAFPGLGHFAINVVADQDWGFFDEDTLPDAVYDFAPWYLLGALLFGWAGGSIYGGFVGFRHVSGLVIQQHYRILIYTSLGTAVGFSVLIALWFLVQLVLSQDWNAYWGFRAYLRWVLVIPMWLVLIGYFSARVFIFIETFICLRGLPPDAYKTVIWEEILPHF